MLKLIPLAFMGMLSSNRFRYIKKGGRTMEHVPTGDGLTRKLATRLNEVAEHRASRWLEELDRVTRVPAKWRLIKRMDEVTEDLTSKWLRELNGRRCWLDYRKAYEP
jgi:hypothetical protein